MLCRRTTISSCWVNHRPFFLQPKTHGNRKRKNADSFPGFRTNSCSSLLFIVMQDCTLHVRIVIMWRCLVDTINDFLSKQGPEKHQCYHRDENPQEDRNMSFGRLDWTRSRTNGANGIRTYYLYFDVRRFGRPTVSKDVDGVILLLPDLRDGQGQVTRTSPLTGVFPGVMVTLYVSKRVIPQRPKKRAVLWQGVCAVYGHVLSRHGLCVVALHRHIF